MSISVWIFNVLVTSSSLNSTVLSISDRQHIFHSPIYKWSPTYLSESVLLNCHSGNVLASHHSEPGSIPNLSMWDGYVVIRLDRLVSFEYYGFNLHIEQMSASMICITFLVMVEQISKVGIKSVLWPWIIIVVRTYYNLSFNLHQ